MSVLIMTEKPSVARDIASVVIGKDYKKCNGYLEGNGYIVTWAVGHLVGLAEPEAYGFVSQAEMFSGKASEAMTELPLLPQEFKLIVLEPTKEQFEIVKKLINDPNVEKIYNYGDAGEEGEILQAFIRWQAGCNKPVLRGITTSMTEEAIKDSLKHLRPQKEFEGRIKGAYCKKKADWILGMSLSRAETLKYYANITVGRVQSPTLYFVVARFMEVKNFKVTEYYGLETKLKEGFSVFWNIDNDGIFPTSAKDSSNRVLNKGLVEDKGREIVVSHTGTVSAYEQKKVGNDRPQLYDITEIQRDANKKYGYSPDLTLACCQCLYETYKILSYPRTDSRYITSDLVPYMKGRVEMIGTVKGVSDSFKTCSDALLKDGLNIDNKIVDDAKVTDHHALIPTEKIKGFDLSSLKPTTDKEKKSGVTGDALVNIMTLVLTRMIVSFSKACIYNQTKIGVSFPNGMNFTASGKTIIEEGWRAVQDRLTGKEEEEKNAEQDEEQTFPPLAKGQTVTVAECITKAKKTTPPKLHTEATLLTAMETAGKGVQGGEILKGKGIGTQATRAEIIKSLFEKGYVEYLKKGKTKYVVPTTMGIRVIQVIPKELYSPMITAEWESKIAEIVDGNLSEEKFMSDFEAFITEKTNEVRNTPATVSFAKEKPIVATCPWCGKGMYRWTDKDDKKKIRYYCSDKECNCSLSSDDKTIVYWSKKPLDEKQMQILLRDGKIFLRVPSMYDKEKKFEQGFELVKKEVNGKTYCNVQSIKKK